MCSSPSFPTSTSKLSSKNSSRNSSKSNSDNSFDNSSKHSIENSSENSSDKNSENTLERLINTNIAYFKPLINVSEMRRLIPQSKRSVTVIKKGRQAFKNVLTQQDHRFVVITGPCSIHDYNAAIAYAEKLKAITAEISDEILVIMRVYFEKPRTTVGWKGLINDPHLDDSFQISDGLKMARKILLKLSELGLYTATEILDPITAAYLAELVCWVAIGARTTESQIHREMVSGLSTPVGFKNSTQGDIDVAVNATRSSALPHSFLGTDDNGKVSIIRTNGNQNTHIVLRGGLNKPNYYSEEIAKAEHKLNLRGLPLRIMIDCSHDNSGKNHEKQKWVTRDIIKQKQKGNHSIFGLMLESHLYPGNQKIPPNISDLKFGVSITDKCIGWDETKELLYELHKTFKSNNRTS
ncbi:phospho-2-dehydro-3-deoxyheptonate aldolase [Spirochaetota bacterium]|nr:phospho-2-dehydro-3-deoxyheptonate aldolase [Spirochaetota bacterium]